MSIISTTKFLFLNSIKDKLLIIFIVFSFLIGCFAIFFGNLAIVEQSFAINSFLATALRLSILSSLCLYICFSIKQLRDGKILQIFIANGLSRNNLIIAAFLNYLIISLIFCLLAFIILCSINFSITINSVIWTLSLFCEALILSGFSLAVITIFNSPVISFLCVVLFYIFSRIVGFMLFMLKSPNNISDFNSALSGGYEILAFIVPRLDFFAKSEWLIYGFNTQEIWLVIIQTIIYVPLILLVSLYDFSKKEL